MLNTPWGSFACSLYEDLPSKQLHLALVQGKPNPATETLVRVHEPTNLLDILDTQSSKHSWPLNQAMKHIAASEAGVAVLLNCASGSAHDTLIKQFDSSHEQRSTPSIGTRKPDFRTYGIGAQILKDQGVGKMRLIAKPSPLTGMSAYQLEVIGYLEPSSN